MIASLWPHYLWYSAWGVDSLKGCNECPYVAVGWWEVGGERYKVGVVQSNIFNELNVYWICYCITGWDRANGEGSNLCCRLEKSLHINWTRMHDRFALYSSSAAYSTASATNLHEITLVRLWSLKASWQRHLFQQKRKHSWMREAHTEATWMPMVPQAWNDAELSGLLPF